MAPVALRETQAKCQESQELHRKYWTLPSFRGSLIPVLLWGVFVFIAQLIALLWGTLVISAQDWLYGSHFFVLPSGKILNDFAYFWGAAKLFWVGKPALVFQPEQFNSWLATQVAPGSMEAFATWSYPPTMLVLLLPFGLIPLPYAMIVWDTVTFLFLGFVLIAFFRNWGVALLVLLSPAALYCLLVQQNGALTAGLLITGLWAVDRRPLIAGICIGALVIKPQLAILVPFAFAAGSHWKAFLSAALTSLTIVSVSLALFGIGAWKSFFDNTAPLMTAQLMHSYGIAPQYAMPTTFVTLQGWGADLRMASLAQGISTLVAVALTVQVWRVPQVGRNWRNALTCTIVLLATPFGYVYDLIPAMLAVALAAQQNISVGFSWWERLVLPSLWVWPTISTVWTGQLGLRPVGCILLLAVALCLWWRMAANSEARPRLAFSHKMWLARGVSDESG